MIFKKYFNVPTLPRPDIMLCFLTNYFILNREQKMQKNDALHRFFKFIVRAVLIHIYIFFLIKKNQHDFSHDIRKSRFSTTFFRYEINREYHLKYIQALEKNLATFGQTFFCCELLPSINLFSCKCKNKFLPIFFGFFVIYRLNLDIPMC